MDKKEELNRLLAILDVPDKRKNDYGWLNRNLLIRNKGEEAEKALEIVKCLLKE